MIKEKDIKKKVKTIIYHYLKKIYDKNLSKLPHNCKHNKTIYINSKKVQICSFDLTMGYRNLEICDTQEDAEKCNAFCSIYTKEGLKDKFIEELKNESLRSLLYKDLNILFWLYPQYFNPELLKKKTIFEKTKIFFYKVLIYIYNRFKRTK